MSVPTLAEVLKQLRAGTELTTPGGRWNLTFAWKAGKLQRTTFDEGLVTREDITEAELAAAIAEYPDVFRRT